jgi:hypothetical protein
MGSDDIEWRTVKQLPQRVIATVRQRQETATGDGDSATKNTGSLRKLADSNESGAAAQ